MQEKKKRLRGIIYKSLIHYRIWLTLLLIGLQAGWFILLILRLSQYSTYLTMGLMLLSMGMLLYVIGRDMNPDYMIGWMLLMAMLPLLGGLLYFLFGNQKPSRRLKERLAAQEGLFREQLEMAEPEVAELSERAAGLCRYIRRSSGYPVYRKTDTCYYGSGEELFAAMLEAVRTAEHTIYMEYFIIETGQMWETLLKELLLRARAGVQIRLIYDDMGCVAKLPPFYGRYLESLHKNIHAMAFNPVRPMVSLRMNHRSHRKLLIIDGHTAFTGGVNIADEYINKNDRLGYWKDSGIRLEGEAVWSFTRMFLELWDAFHEGELCEGDPPQRWHPVAFHGSGYVQPFSDTPLDEESLSRNVYLDLISQARRYVYLSTPYLILDHEMRSALTLAAGRGVDVRIVTPGIPDKKLVFRLTRSNYAPLLKGGVRIYEFTPGFCHAKNLLCDGEFGIVGTVNMDYRSLYLHFECAALLYQTQSLADMKRDAEETFEKSREITRRDCHEGVVGRLLDAVLRLFAPLC